MKNNNHVCQYLHPSAARILLLCLFFLFPHSAPAQTGAVRSLIVQPIDESNRVVLKGNTYPLARPEFDQGPAPESLALHRMILVLKRSPEREAALETLLDQQQDKASPNYHNWLTSSQFGQRFGPADEDVQSITSWLASHGFEVARVSSGRTLIEFSGTVSQVFSAFHTQIHKYHVNGEDHWANASDPQIPTALVPGVAGVLTLHNFPRKEMHQAGGVYKRSKDTGKAVLVTPSTGPGTLFTLPAPGGCGVQPADCYAVSPSDFGTIYDVYPLWNAKPTPINGTGETIAVVAQSDIDPNDVTSFRKYFGLPVPANLTITVSGPDPGKNGAETEADLDVEWAGAIAPNATINLVVSESTEVSLGADLSAIYIVDNNLAPVMNVSFGICELGLGTTGNQFLNQLWQQAAAQGITVMVATGDSGADVCDRSNNPPPAPAVSGLSVSGYSSTPYNVAIGGTDFNDLTNAATYWNLSNAPPAYNPSAIPTASAKSYIPETTWNDTCTNEVFGNLLGFSPNAETNCNNPQLINFVVLEGGSGGKSNCTTSDGQNVSSCSGGYGKPSWQVGTGVPADKARDVPDASLFAAIGSPSGSFYIVCEADALPAGVTSCDPNDPATEFLGIGGTSASAPTFSALMALVNQKTNSRQGNANYVLYKLAAQQPGVFHDVPAGGTIAMPCAKGSANCTVTNPADNFGVLSGYPTTAGYDLATGWGSVDANNLVTKWNLVSTQGSQTTLSLTPTPVNITHGQAVDFSISVKPAGAGGGQPTGNVSLIANTGPSPSGQEGVQGFPLVNGAASGSTIALPGGNNYTVIARYPGDGVFGPSDSSGVTVSVAPEASKVQMAYELFNPTTGLQTNPNATSAQYGSLAILRANVTSHAGDACAQNTPGELGCPTGSIAITNNGAPLDAGTYQLNSLGYAEDQTVQLPGGTNNLSAAYGGDASFMANTRASTITITKAPTTTGVNTPVSTVIFGLFVQLNAAISSVGLGAGPTGQVTFFSGATQLGAPVPVTNSVGGTLNSNPGAQATINTSQLPLGNNSITAQYSGDGNYAASTSPPIPVDAQIVTFCSMSSSNLTIARGSSVTFTVTVNPNQAGGPGPTGSVVFTAVTGNPTTLGTVPLANGQAQLTTSALPGGNIEITAKYAGDANYMACNNNVFETVNLLPTSTTVGTSNPAIQQGQSVTLTAHVAPVQQGGPALTGTVQFYTAVSLTGSDNPIGAAVALSNGQAQLTTTSLPANIQFVVAGYSGDSNYASSDGTTAQTVAPAPDFQISANPLPINVPRPGAPGSTTLTITGQNGYNGTINLSAAMFSNLPPESSGSFSSASVTGSGSTMLTILTAAPSQVIPDVRPRGPSRWTPAGVLALSSILFFLSWFFRTRPQRRRVSAVLAVFAFAALIAIAACGGSGGGNVGPSNPGTPPNLYPNVSVTLSDGTHNHTFVFSVNVQ